MLNKFYICIGIFFATSISAKSLPTKEQIESNEEYRLIRDYRIIPCALIDENTDYATQNKCFHISKRLFEITKNKTFLAGVAKGYYKGYGVDQNVKKGLKLYEEMANSDGVSAVDAQAILGVYYGAKDSPVIDRVKEEYWVKRAADNGCSLSQYTYARILKNRGKLNDAIYWYKKAASNGNLMAKYKLAVFFNQGYPMQINRRQAYELLHEAAEQDFAPAFQELYFLYDEDGSCEKAKFWYSKYINSQFFNQIQSGVNADEALIEIFKEKKKKEYIAEVQKEIEEIEKQSSKQK